jgi:hypothetical protein
METIFNIASARKIIINFLTLLVMWVTVLIMPGKENETSGPYPAQT